MSDALRPSSLLTAAPPATAPSGVLGTLPNPPPEVSQLPAGTTLRGTVVGQDDKGRLLVRTDLGILAVLTKANLPPGAEVVLQIRSSGAQLHVLLMQSDITAKDGATQRGLPPGPPPTGTLPSPPSVGAPPPDQLTLGQNIRAILQTPAPANIVGNGALDPAIVAAVARLAPGSQIVLRIISVEAPTIGTPTGTTPTGAPQTPSASVIGGTTPGPIAGQVPGQGPAAPSPIPGQAGINAPPVGTGAGAGAPTLATPTGGLAAPPGTPLAQAGQILSPVAGTPVPGSSSTPSTLSASPSAVPPTLGPTAPPTSVGAAYAAAQGSPVFGPYAGQAGAPLPSNPVAAATTPVQASLTPGITPSPTSGGPAVSQITGVVTATTNAGHPVLQTPIGTLTLEVQASLPIGSRVAFEWAPGALSSESASLPTSLARAWPEIEEVVRVLHEVAPSGIASTTTIPQPGVKLASGLLFFLSALSGGDISQWLGGQAVQTLKAAGRDNLLTRLGQDFGQLSRNVESGGADWRLFLIPLHDGSQVQQIRFFERHGSRGRGADDDQKDGDSTRFILEIELSRVGDMQIDGLVRDKRFDLMLRTRRPLPDVMRHDIIEIFTDANDAAGFAGTIGFQASRDWRFMPVNDAAPAAAESGLVI